MKMSSVGGRKFELDDYELLQTIGAGSFARVKLVRNLKTDELFALKVLKKSEIVRLKQTDHVMSEIRVLFDLDHPFLVKLTGFDQDDKLIYLLMEYVPGGELYSYLKSEGKLPVATARFYGAQVAMMLEGLHKKGIVYRDLKPENVLIAENGYLKLIDFGLAKHIKSRTYTVCGTPEYMAPEILLNKGYGFSADWWSLGILIYEMLSGIDPFMDEDPMQIYQKILKGRVRFPRSMDRDSRSIIKHLLVANTSLRYGCGRGGIKEIQTHRWFRSIDFDKLLKFFLPAPYIPHILDPADASNYSSYPESEEEPVPLKASEDPFIDW